MSETFEQTIARVKAVREAREAEEDRLTRLAAALPAPGSKPLPPPAGSTPISSEPGAGAGSEKEYAPILPRVGSDFMSEVKSIIARFQRAKKSNAALLFFTGFCDEAFKKAGMGKDFSQSKIYWLAGELKKWQTYMLAIPAQIKTKIDSDPLNSYYWIQRGMELFEDKVINSVKIKFRDRAFPERFFTDLLRSYQIGDGRLYMTGIGGKRRKTRKVRKSKRQTKLRIKRRLTMS